jgi:hypothetical protein
MEHNNRERYSFLLELHYLLQEVYLIFSLQFPSNFMQFKMFIMAKYRCGVNIFCSQDKMKNEAYVYIAYLEELVCLALCNSCHIFISVCRRE